MRTYLTTSSRLGTGDDAEHGELGGELVDLMVLEAGSAGIAECAGRRYFSTSKHQHSSKSH